MFSKSLASYREVVIKHGGIMLNSNANDNRNHPSVLHQTNHYRGRVDCTQTLNAVP